MKPLERRYLQEILKGIPIPSSPAVLSELRAELQSPAPSHQSVARIVGRDVGLSAAVLKSANSPPFGSNGQISSVTAGIKLIGFDTLASLIHERLSSGGAGASGGASLERFWDSSSYVALVCADLAEALGGIPPDTAHVFGLFRDCGIPLLVQRFPDYKKLLGRANDSPNRDFTAVEDDAIFTNHAVMGYLLTRSWKLPKTLAAGILHHHDYELLRDEDHGLAEQTRLLIAIGAFADHITGQHLRLKQDQEWKKAGQKVAAYFSRTDQEISDLADDMLYRLDKKEQGERRAQ
ncbi:MAG: HDOD domain-containing protein [Betaproteobacteria bacterium]|nr:HDOD domain-containing protein [Betaproteobacteria bacterium]